MSVEEFSDQFDVLLNSSFIESDFGEQSNKIDIQLDEYEKSVFLTQAQEQLVINLYNGRNVEGLSFESAEESRRYLKELTKRQNVTTFANNNDGLFPYSYIINLNDDCLFITKETAEFDLSNVTSKPDWLTNNAIVEVIPITQDDYHRIKRNPYKKFNDYRVLRIEDNNQFVLLSKYKLSNYAIDYIKKPKPIILTELGKKLTINGYYFGKNATDYNTSNIIPEGPIYASDCELNPILHRTILLEAVKLAKVVKQNQIRSEMLSNMPGQLVHPPIQPVNQLPN